MTWTRKAKEKNSICHSNICKYPGFQLQKCVKVDFRQCKPKAWSLQVKITTLNCQKWVANTVPSAYFRCFQYAIFHWQGMQIFSGFVASSAAILYGQTVQRNSISRMVNAKVWSSRKHDRSERLREYMQFLAVARRKLSQNWRVVVNELYAARRKYQAKHGRWGKSSRW